MLYKVKRVHMSRSSHSFWMTIQQSQIHIQGIFLLSPKAYFKNNMFPLKEMYCLQNAQL